MGDAAGRNGRDPEDAPRLRDRNAARDFIVRARVRGMRVRVFTGRDEALIFADGHDGSGGAAGTVRRAGYSNMPMGRTLPMP